MRRAVHAARRAWQICYVCAALPLVVVIIIITRRATSRERADTTKGYFHQNSSAAAFQETELKQWSGFFTL